MPADALILIHLHTTLSSSWVKLSAFCVSRSGWKAMSRERERKRKDERQVKKLTLSNSIHLFNENSILWMSVHVTTFLSSYLYNTATDQILLECYIFPHNVKSLNTPGTAGGSGGRDLTLAVKSRKTVKKSPCFFAYIF